MTVFITLLRREWLQHQNGWLLLVALPACIAMLLAAFTHLQLAFDADDMASFGHDTPLLVTAGATFAVAALSLAMAWLTVAVMSPGLARRDQQDRSIEFWRSLPVGDSSSIAATLLMHLWLVPALALGVAGGLVAGILASLREFGWGALGEMPWLTLLSAALALLARLSLAVVLVPLWLSPLLLAAMVAAAWGKRWGLPLVLAGLGLAVVVVDRLLPMRIVGPALTRLASEAGTALFASRDSLHGSMPAGMGAGEALGQFPAFMLEDAGTALSHLAAPSFVVALAFSALCFGLLVWQRQRDT